MIFLIKKSFDFNHDLNQWLKSARFKSANPDCNGIHPITILCYKSPKVPDGSLDSMLTLEKQTRTSPVCESLERLWTGFHPYKHQIKFCAANYERTTTPPQPFYSPFPGPLGWAGARRELLDFMVQGKINRGRHSDHPDGRHSIWTKQCASPNFFTGRMPLLLPNQQCQNTEGN